MTRKLWQFPWGYPESTLFVASLALVGFLLQLTVGHFDVGFLHAPANLIAFAILIGLILLGVRFQNTLLVRWVSGIPMAVTLTAAVVLVGLCMELTPQLSRLPSQAPANLELGSRLGFRMVTSSWPFVLLYGMTLIALGIATFKRLFRFSRQDITFLCNHLGLWMLLVSAGFGAADMMRVVMHVQSGETEWRVFDKDGEALELPIAITLKKFTMEEYPPNLTIMDGQAARDPQPSQPKGKSQPKSKQGFFQIDPKRPKGQIGDWAITLDDYLHTAVRIDGEYRVSPMPESTPAAKVTARNLLTGETKTAWVSSGGNVPEFFSAIPLDDRYVLVMTQPEPKRYASDVTIIPKDGSPIDAILEVNKPVSVGNWMIYQYGYETALGKMSPWSEMELVYDPWLLPAKISMGLMAIGALLMVWNGTGKRKSASNELERIPFHRNPRHRVLARRRPACLPS
ncbi:MAG: cytochrome c biogenesis protein ResB [Polyangiaceae bacterium]|nr:cytochrome c biogenesis protein ResB [Polyangiaceae bacterium]